MEQLKGSLENVIFHNEKNGYTVADFDVDGEMVTVVGAMESPRIGEYLSMTGYFREHPVYGGQFQMETYAIDLPSTEDGMIRYLGSGILPGVGEKTAREIVQTFGSRTLDVLDNHPEELLQVHGIGKKTLERILEEYQEQREVRDVLIRLQEYGISSAYAMKLYAVYKADTVSVLLDDPYRIVRDVRGIGFKIADQIAFQMGVDAENPKRIMAGIVHSLRECYARGNTYMTEEELIRTSQQILAVAPDEIENQLGELALAGQVYIDEVDGQPAYYPMGLYEAEDNTALAMVRLIGSAVTLPQIDLDGRIVEYEKTMSIHLDDCQVEAIKTAISHGVAIITGGPGTGKTTIINGVLTILKAMNLKVLLAAPTGRAAKRITETTGEAATTIHRLLEYDYTEDDDFPSFNRDESNPLEADAVIIDEASMIDIVLMDSLLAALAPGTRLILVGDADQLPSVGPGNVLGDLIESGIVTVVRLNKIYRQSEKSMISVNARDINEGLIPAIDNHSDFVFIRKSEQKAVLDTILELMDWRLRDNMGIDVLKEVQVISPIKKGQVGVIALNQEIQAILNPPAEGKNERVSGNTVFREGDKVMQIRNNYQLHWEEADTLEEGEGVYNGDIGLITRIDSSAKTMTIRFTDDKVAVYDFDQLDELTHAFAMTVHKSQGSEFPVVIMPMTGGPPMFLNRKLLYTAVTRAKKMLILVGGYPYFARMVHSNETTRRRTALVPRIRMYQDMVGQK